MILIFQLLFLAFSAIAIGSVVMKKRSGLIGPRGAWFWVLFWLLADAAMLRPDSVTVLANHLGIGRGADFVLYVSLAVIFFLLFKLHLKIESIGRDITRVVRKDALEKQTRPIQK